MTTIGYGDLHPVSNKEKIYMCFVSIISCGMFAYCVSTISTIVSEYYT